MKVTSTSQAVVSTTKGARVVPNDEEELTTARGGTSKHVVDQTHCATTGMCVQNVEAQSTLKRAAPLVPLQINPMLKRPWYL